MPIRAKETPRVQGLGSARGSSGDYSDSLPTETHQTIHAIINASASWGRRTPRQAGVKLRSSVPHANTKQSTTMSSTRQKNTNSITLMCRVGVGTLRDKRGSSAATQTTKRVSAAAEAGVGTRRSRRGSSTTASYRSWGRHAPREAGVKRHNSVPLLAWCKFSHQYHEF